LGSLLRWEVHQRSVEMLHQTKALQVLLAVALAKHRQLLEAVGFSDHLVHSKDNKRPPLDLEQVPALARLLQPLDLVLPVLEAWLSRLHQLLALVDSGLLLEVVVRLHSALRVPLELHVVKLQVHDEMEDDSNP
jgi:hypothetical protein